MEQTPPHCTLIALPYVSKLGFVAGFLQSWTNALLTGNLRPSRVLYLGDHMTSAARNKACEIAIEQGDEWVLFLDSDMDFPPDVLPRLKAVDADIACIDMWSRGWPSFRTVLRNGPVGEDGLIQSVPVSDEDAKGVLDVDVCGMACTLIRTDLLKRYRDHFKDQPWFWVARHGEDATFCFNAKEIGASIKCDFGAVAGHWGVCRNVGQDFTRDARNQPMAVSDEPMMRRMGAVGLPNQEGAAS